MSPKNPLIFFAGTLFFGFAAIAAFQAYRVWGLIFLVQAAILFALAVFLSYRSRYVLIDEMEVGVIFNRFNNSFCRFEQSPEPMPKHDCRDYRIPRWIPFGLQWLKMNDPYFFRLRWHEELTGTIPKRAQSASGKLENIRTKEGVPITIPWKVSYTIDVSLIPEKIKHKMARALPEHSEKVVTGRVERAIKHLVELRTIEELYGEAAIQQLEAAVAEVAFDFLSNPVNLGFKQIPPKDVVLGPMVMPPKVEKALELAHQRKIQAETVAAALERLKKAVDGFSEEDIRRWSDLERLRILDDKAAGTLYLSDAFVRTESVKEKRHLNGRSRRKV